ncbi:hypothetical protein [Fictibacillus halophilus]|uniref:hypothetical protein n=1 Tax=Fictibacillus halophilus TaxID=1610490 RepID=UPI001CF961F0|nr:hypothetical protein [Fictibacillus halophilus]
MPGITFEIIGEKKRVFFNEEIQDYLLKRESEYSYNLLLHLDKYGDYTFTIEEIQELIVICDRLHSKYGEEFNWDHNRVRKFCLKLKNLCQIARTKKKRIQAIGE